MPYTIPTAAEFKARHGKFTAVADALVTAMLTDASRSVTTSWIEADYQDGIMYLAAHLMVEEGALNAASSPSSTTGPVQEIKAGDVTVKFDQTGSRYDGELGKTYGSTVYGRRYLELARRNGASAAVMMIV